MINIDALNDDEKLAALESIHKSIAESKEIQKKKITTNVELIVKALKKIESDLKQRYDETGQLIANLKNGEDGRDGKDGKDGKNGRDGRDGPMGPRGYDGLPGRNGIDGTDGVSITDAHIDFDGSLIISLSSGRVINVGEVVAADIAEKIKVITNGGGTSQGVLDAIASLQAQISAIVSGLSYKGTWNATTNVPTLTSSVGTAGFYYIVSVAGSTNLNGITDWQVGDWAVFSGTVWQKLDQTNLVTSVAGRTGAVTLTTADIGGLGTIATQAANNVSITGGSITGITDLAIADGGTGASTAANARTNLGATTVGANVFTLTNPSAITFPRFNADNTVSALDAATFRTAIGAGTSSTTGTVTSVAASVPTFLSISGSPITSSGTLAITLSGTALPTTSGGTGLTSFTANGVVYASSTSALTTGSGLTFDGTNLNVLSAGLNVGDGTTTLRSIASGGLGMFGTSTNHPLAFRLNNTEEMRLTSTGLGIGTSSPSAKLHVYGSSPTAFVEGTASSDSGVQTKTSLANFKFGAGIGSATNCWNVYDLAGGGERLRIDSVGNVGIGSTAPVTRLQVNHGSSFVAGFKSTVANGYIALQDSGTSGALTDGNVAIGAISNDLAFRSGGATRMRLDSAGNLGLGVAPSAWDSNLKVFQIGALGSVAFDGGSSLDFASNSYYATSFKYISSSSTAKPARFVAGNGAFYWFNAPAGTAGNAITFTQAMTLDASGNLSNVGNLSVNTGGLATYFRASGTAYTQIGDNQTLGAGTAFVIGSSTPYLAFNTAGSERMRITSAGNVGIGTTSPQNKFVVSNSGAEGLEIVPSASGSPAVIAFNRGTASYIRLTLNGSEQVFQTSGTERARIDSNGAFYLNCTSSPTSNSTGTGGLNTLVSSGDAFNLKHTNDGATIINLWQTGTTGNAAIVFNKGNTQTAVGSITINTTATAYNTSSDYRLKNTIAPMTGALAKVALLKPCTYKWNADGSDGEGFIAHELAEVVPQCVTGEKDAVDEEGNPKYQGIDVSFLVATLTAAIQELKAEFDAYKASHP